MTRLTKLWSIPIVLFLILPSRGAFAYDSAANKDNYISQTQNRRSAERFNILDFIGSQKMAINAQNSRWGHAPGGSGPWPDFVLTYMQDSGPVTRNGANLGRDSRSMGRLQFLMDSLFTQGNQKKSMNIDLGVEGFMSQTTGFVRDPASTQGSHSFSETGGGILIRPYGRSSQDTGLLLKGGYENVPETGLFANNSTLVTLYAPYAGVEGRLYLLNFLGLQAEYNYAFETSVSALNGKWKMQKFTYGAFVEISLFSFGLYYMNTELDLTDNLSGGVTKELYSGTGILGTVFF